jgi:AraC family transcriptional activator of pobA
MNIIIYKTISQYHNRTQLDKPEHPLISLVDYGKVDYGLEDGEVVSWVQDYYSISLKKNINFKMRYGQQEYDFDEGLMTFFSPGQVLRITNRRQLNKKPSGWILLIHPDFLWNTSLAKKIKNYEFFGYSINEALFLSEKEEKLIEGILMNIRHEYHSNIDKFSQNIIVSHIEVLLNYAERFYQRQFITRKKAGHQILESLETILDDCVRNEDSMDNTLPTVQYVADQLSVSPNYLSTLLKSLTGQNTRQHIQNKLIERAKEQLSTTELSVSEIAYSLGFEHSQSFSRMFKSKTKLSPLAFREKFS